MAALSQLAVLYIDREEDSKAESAVRQLTAAAADVKDIRAVRAQHDAAMAYFRRGNYVVAKKIDSQALAACTLLDRNSTACKASISTSLGTAYENLKDYPHAEASFRQALAIFETDPAAGSNTAGALEHLAKTLQDESKWTDAIAAYQRAEAVAQKALGPDHPMLASLSWELGSLYWERSAMNSALSQFQRASIDLCII